MFFTVGFIVGIIAGVIGYYFYSGKDELSDILAELKGEIVYMQTKIDKVILSVKQTP